MKLPQKAHFTGICGVGTSALAIALHKAGVAVNGSDKGFFPPVSTALESAGVPFYPGWHPENIGKPDVLIAGGGGTSLSNPELQYAKEHNIPIISFAEAVGNYVVRKNSIVTVGTWGKTTTATLLSFILKEANMNPSYFTGGVPIEYDAGEITDSDWSVVEGDEYQAAIWDKKAKFNYHKPTHLILSELKWDHADMYPTEASYLDAFRNLVRQIPRDKTRNIVACMDSQYVRIMLGEEHIRPIWYGQDAEADYRYEDISETKDGVNFTIIKGTDKYHISSPMLGRYNVENITGAFAMATEIGVQPEIAIRGIAKFKGIKRRLEKRFEGNVTVIDTHAPTPDKAKAGLETLRGLYTGKIIAVFEPNIGGREYGTAAKYDNAFTKADIVIIPRLSKLKVSEDGDRPMEGPELATTIAKTHKDVRYIEDDIALLETLRTEAKSQDLIVFMGSHGFRNMIEGIISLLQ